MYRCSVESMEYGRKEFGPYATRREAERAYRRLVAATAASHHADGVTRIVRGPEGAVTVIDGHARDTTLEQRDVVVNPNEEQPPIGADTSQGIEGFAFNSAGANNGPSRRGNELRQLLSLALETIAHSSAEVGIKAADEHDIAGQERLRGEHLEQVYVLTGDQFVTFFDALTDTRRIRDDHAREHIRDEGAYPTECAAHAPADTHHEENPPHRH